MFKAWMWKQRSFREKALGDGEGSTGGSGDGSQGGKTEDKGGDADDGSGAGDGGEGKPKPTDAEAKLLKEVMDKKTALRNTQTELNDVKAKLAAFGDLDASELKELVKEKKALETRKLEEKGEWDRLKAQMAEENTKVVDGVKTLLTAAEQRAEKLAKQVAELTVGSSFASSTFIKDELTLPPSKARTLYGSHFEADESGNVVAFDKPAGAAERTQLVDSQGQPLNFEAALKKLVEADPDREQITKSKVKPGTGSRPTEKGKPAQETFDQPKGIDRIAAALRAQQAAK